MAIDDPAPLWTRRPGAPVAAEGPAVVEATLEVSSTPTRRLFRRVCRVGVLAASDTFGLMVAGTVAYFAWALPVRSQLPAQYAALAPFLVTFVLAYAQAGLYPGLGLGPVERLRRYSYATGFVFLLLAAASFALKLPHRYSRVSFALALLLSLVLLPLLRAAVLHLAGRLSWWREPVVIVGTTSAAGALAATLEKTPALGYRAVASLAAGQRELEQFAIDFAARGVRVALVSGRDVADGDPLELLQQHFEHVVVTGGFGELPVEGAVVRDLGGALGIEYTSNLLRWRNRLVKRAMDLVFGVVLLVACAPLIGLACVVVKLLSPGPGFYVQRRPGRGGQVIPVPKIRTMLPEADQRLAEHLEQDAALGEEWRQHLKLRHDPRLVPGVGRWLRRLSIDELPQLWSVVRGDMSLVGPRPFPGYHLQRFPAHFLELRQRVRPGITGLWQVVIRSAGSLAEQQALDTHYIRSWSIWLDVYILARTAAAVISGRGAY
jgi:Undecaprenyl-phosphate galactose phosphotransferase WbaP